MPGAPVVEARDVRVEVRHGKGVVVRDVALEIGRGEVLGLVGESGSGKTSLALSLLGYAKPQLEITAGDIWIDRVGMLDVSAAELCQLRGSTVAYVPQDPVTALNPALRIGTQLREVLEVHSHGNHSEHSHRISEVLVEVGLPSHREFLRRFPHQLSGGQLQRVTIAMTFSCMPRAVVLDEPTTGLDVTTQALILETIRRMCQSHGVAALYVSHDLAVVAQVADRVAVMYAGRLVEHGPTVEVLSSAAHPYTRRLLAAAPSAQDDRPLAGIPGTPPTSLTDSIGCSFAPRCADVIDVCKSLDPDEQPVRDGHAARCHRVGEPDLMSSTSVVIAPRDRREPLEPSKPGRLVVERLTAGYGSEEIVHDVSLTVATGECVALVGESGSGKTTLARCIAGLHGDFDGQVEFDGEVISPSVKDRTIPQRRAMQYVFQNPYSSLNPRRTIRDSLALPIAVFEGRVAAKRSDDRIVDALERVSISADYIRRLPAQLSGGERQRVAIARALVVRPKYLMCDEVTSALDVSVQASIVQLLAELQHDEGLGLLFVTHNLPLVRSVAKEVIVLKNGMIVEHGSTGDVFERPRHAYTQRLLGDLPKAVHTNSATANVVESPATAVMSETKGGA